MKKWCLLFILLPMSVHAACFHGVLGQNGQTQMRACVELTEAERICSEGKDSYWDGQACRKVEVIQSCKAQGGEWIGIQIMDNSYPRELLRQAKSVCASSFCNICLCPGGKTWDGQQCLANAEPARNCGVDAWCEMKMTDMTVAVTSEFLGFKRCARK